MVRSLSAQNGSWWINGTNAGTCAWAQNYSKIKKQSKIPYCWRELAIVSHKIFSSERLRPVTWKWRFFPLKTFGCLPFQPISDVTNIMFGISFACQSSELLPTVRKPGLPTLPHAKRCSIQVPPKLSLSLSFSVLENLLYSRDQLTLQAAKAVGDFAKRWLSDASRGLVI